jgi:hypothetical protein
MIRSKLALVKPALTAQPAYFEASGILNPSLST